MEQTHLHADEKKVEYYQRAIALDQYLAVAYFQEGVSNFLMGDFEEALANFNDTLLYLRGNTYIDYDQLGLKFRLYSCEVLFNRGLCYIYLQQEKPGMQDFTFAVKEKMTPDHDVIDEAIRDRAEGYTVFSIPVGVLYRPNEAKVKNLKTKDYLGKARLIAASSASNTSTGFQGADRKQALEKQITGTDDRPPESISYAATNLVQKNLSSRQGRDHSAPPVMGRNVFPPTPPPENEKPVKHSSTGSHALPVRTTSRSSNKRPPLPAYKSDSEVSGSEAERRAPPTYVPPQLAALANATPPPPQPQNASSRPRPSRTASEPRGPSSRRVYERQANPRTQGPLYGESSNLSDQDSNDEVYKLYQSSQTNGVSIRRPGSARQAALRQQPYIDEEDEYTHGDNQFQPYENDDFDLGGGSYPTGNLPPTSMMKNSNPSKRPPLAHSSSSNTGTTEPSRGSLNGHLSKIRVKVHANDDTRYIMVGPTIEYGELESKIREKFAIKSQLRIKMEDDGDMITMADQEDLEMLLTTVRMLARKEKNEMGKMEVSCLVTLLYLQHILAQGF